MVLPDKRKFPEYQEVLRARYCFVCLLDDVCIIDCSGKGEQFGHSSHTLLIFFLISKGRRDGKGRSHSQLANLLSIRNVEWPSVIPGSLMWSRF